MTLELDLFSAQSDKGKLLGELNGLIKEAGLSDEKGVIEFFGRMAEERDGRVRDTVKTVEMYGRKEKDHLRTIERLEGRLREAGVLWERGRKRQQEVGDLVLGGG